MIEATNESKSYEPAPAGNHVAICFSMIHIGRVKESFKGEDKELDKVRIAWELPEELKEFKEGEGAKPITVSKEFTLSMNEKANLRKFLESWRGKGFTEEEAKRFDITKLLGKPCMLSVIHKTSKHGKVYADISSVSALPKKMEAPTQINANFELNYMEWDQKKFDSLPDYIKDKMKTSKQYKYLHEPENKEIESASGAESDDNDDLPF